MKNMDIPIKVGSEVCFFARTNHHSVGIKQHDMVIGKVMKITKDEDCIRISGNAKGFIFDRTYKEGTVPEVYLDGYDCKKCCWLHNQYTVSLL